MQPSDSHILQPSKRIEFLDYLRIFAFLSVVVGHQFYIYLESATQRSVGWLHSIVAALLPFFWGGGAGVVVFFLVSGYVITYVMEYETLGAFAIKRVFRLFPLYWAALLAETLFLDAEPEANWTVLLPRMLLAGDVFSTPYALKNVEWTLRVEVLFYAIMVGIGWLRLRALRAAHLPWLFLAITIVLYLSPPIPDFVPWSRGLTTLFLPFLFIGANCYLWEKRLAPRAATLLVSVSILVGYTWMRSRINPQPIVHPFVAYGVGLFIVAWIAQRHFPTSRVITLFSGLTYGVYLFHHWAWDWLGRALHVVPGTGVLVRVGQPSAGSVAQGATADVGA